MYWIVNVMRACSPRLSFSQRLSCSCLSKVTRLVIRCESNVLYQVRIYIARLYSKEINNLIHIYEKILTVYIIVPPFNLLHIRIIPISSKPILIDSTQNLRSKETEQIVVELDDIAPFIHFINK